MIRLTVPEIGDEEIAALVDVLRSGFLVQGSHVKAFEQAVAKYVGVEHAVACSSGTAALHLAMLALEIGPGDEVIVPDFTWPATANVVSLVGASPVLVDIDPITYNMDPEALRRALSSRTRAIIPVHLFGLAADMGAILELARVRDIPVVEDAACALGAYYRGQKCGSLGLLGCFSFHPRKSITTGEGGMITTNDAVLAQKLRSLRNHGVVQGDDGLSFEMAGLNYRLTELQGALGTVQMQRLPAILARRRQVADAYLQALADCRHLSLPLEPVNARHTWQSFVVVLNDGIDRGRIVRQLRERAIEATLGTYSLSSQPFFAGRGYHCPASWRVFRQTLCLPLHCRMDPKEIQAVVRSLKELTGDNSVP